MNIRPIRYDHPDAVKLNDRVQLEYDERYGDGGDVTPLDATMFDPPSGLYLLAYDAHDQPVATGGWRNQDTAGDHGYRPGDAELKRMYVIPEARGLGLARRILTALEESARAAGRIRMVLETGDKQPEAIALYLSSGYTLCEKFGHYREYETSRCFEKQLAPADSPAPVHESVPVGSLTPADGLTPTDS
ncbi:GNAT family N-acetyltransferase [Streptomyces sp. NBC_01267]|uniref:GNAT family N-acetyltransferase n=1 Tax=unclassified Streptomyces TaxID=2593676 RepID=UPI0022563763|nr:MULTISPECIES: GNAT family N-acetyltransferase [unclassified Streptomyces]MCX4550398.1 GNAT family N-acetyltransferase [Streptomyces sp. NBC_01500]WSC21854.1 GNAT family N-acetyltransferase [Streptomyces sp. NBC_01766]WSV55809.1 GNAT family N-acetyltransferase [Streptomyces sp. NBC_01014]